MSKSNLALNRAIAEKIMGLTLFQEPLYGDWYHQTESGAQFAVPNYAGDPRATMAVVEEMRKTHVIFVTFGDESPCGVETLSRADGATFETDAETFPRCLCLAALRARGHSTEEL